MITLVTLLVFTIATGSAVEYAWLAPERRGHQEVERRLRGLRVEAGRRPGSLLRQQHLSGAGFLSRFELMKGLQDTIDQARLPYRAGNVLTESLALLAVSYLVADALGLFPFQILKVMFALACSIVPVFYIRIKRQKRMREIEEILPDSIDLFTRAMRAGHNIQSGLAVLAEETPEPLGSEFKKVVEDLALGSTA